LKISYFQLFWYIGNHAEKSLIFANLNFFGILEIQINQNLLTQFPIKPIEIYLINFQ